MTSKIEVDVTVVGAGKSKFNLQLLSFIAKILGVRLSVVLKTDAQNK